MIQDRLFCWSLVLSISVSGGCHKFSCWPLMFVFIKLVVPTCWNCLWGITSNPHQSCPHFSLLTAICRIGRMWFWLALILGLRSLGYLWKVWDKRHFGFHCSITYKWRILSFNFNTLFWSRHVIWCFCRTCVLVHNYLIFKCFYLYLIFISIKFIFLLNGCPILIFYQNIKFLSI